MLIRFSFKNFKSFKNENCLDMEATSLKEHEYNREFDSFEIKKSLKAL